MSRTITTTPLYVRNKDTGELQPVAMMSGDMPEIKEELKEQKESLSALSEASEDHEKRISTLEDGSGTDIGLFISDNKICMEVE